MEDDGQLPSEKADKNAQGLDPWYGLIVLHEQVAYTQQDAARFITLFSEVWAQGTEPWKSKMLENKAAYYQELLQDGKNPTNIISGFPTESDIQQDESICIAYAWLEQEYGMSEEVLRHFSPFVSFRINLEDTATSLCDIYFQTWATEEFQVYGWYQIFINA
jgi:hypothetical protein